MTVFEETDSASAVGSPINNLSSVPSFDDPHLLVVALALSLARMAAREDDEVESSEAADVLVFDVP
jgi:hypothetical protein